MSLPQDINDREHRKFEEVAGQPAVRVTEADTTSQGATKKYFLKEVLTDSGNTYLGKQATDQAWLFQKITSTNAFTYATIKNNSTVTDYTSAKSAYTSLTYGTPPEAF